jgi:hypothetical protein
VRKKMIVGKGKSADELEVIQSNFKRKKRKIKYRI